MSKLAQVTRAAGGTLILLFLPISCPAAQQVTKQPPGTGAKRSMQTPTGHPKYLKAFVIDDRLSALRREPGLQSEVIRRIRLGHTVFIVGTSNSKAGQPRFCRVAVTRRTRGWLHESALAVKGRVGEDQHILKLIEGNPDGVDRITLCRILDAHFSHSRLVPRAMLLLGEEAERVAETLSQRTHRRLAEVHGADVRLRDYYLSDAGLDRYSKLGVVFDFNESTGELVYEGKAYREIVRRFPGGEEARRAREHLELNRRKMAQQH